jgi:predicted PolB exonuclease-like 3'-5' exonuclease
MYVVMDIETIPDPTVWSPGPARLKVEKTKPTKTDLAFLKLAVDAVGAGKVHQEDANKALAIAELCEDKTAIDALSPFADAKPDAEFPPVYAHQPIVIGHLLLDEAFAVKSIGTAADEEPALLTSWATFMNKSRPTIVTWNGRGFDLPVLNLRSLQRGIPQRWYTQYRNRYKEDHLDLCDVLGEFGAVPRMKLNDVARTIGLPGKYGIDGSMVAGLYAAGKVDLIRTYCLTDVLTTAWIFLRVLLVRGQIDVKVYQTAAQGLLATCRQMPELTEFVGLIDEKRLMLEG